MNDYKKFIEAKKPRVLQRGLTVAPTLSSHLFDFQKNTVAFALQCGAAGLFLDTGLGKTLCQLEYLEHACDATNGKALLLTPLAVAHQIKKEADKFGYPAKVIRDQSEVFTGINICNYDRLHLLEPSSFGAVTLDEGSIIKSFGGKTSQQLIDAFTGCRFKMPATATPAPNDHMELGQYAEFCEIMQSNEMLSRFFINDTAQASQQWRLKRHGVDAFWNWMASWSRMAQFPSDLGGDDTGFILPPINVHRHRAAESAPRTTGGLFGDEPVSATTMHETKRATAENRAKICAELVTSNNDPWVIWVDTDYEDDAVLAALKGVDNVVDVRGSMTPEMKERHLDMFADGTARIVVTKSSVADVCSIAMVWTGAAVVGCSAVR